MITATRSQTRILPREDYSRLAGTELEAVAAHLPPGSDVIVVERDGELVACWALVLMPHVEGLWIHPAHRKGSVARRLWSGMRSLLRLRGIGTVMTAAVSDEVRALLEHVDAERLPGDHYVMRFPEGKSCQQQ